MSVVEENPSDSFAEIHIVSGDLDVYQVVTLVQDADQTTVRAGLTDLIARARMKVDQEFQKKAHPEGTS